ncbi:MAG TPA: lactonase family protein [Candidatus Limivivens intestinipullorum]|uniref:Lactonase family protein n=1 Tax=Candidatus Limivivens intestinipullorum TaxID=2840858 RepID=A0A9D1EUR8_9FIRM|nr:lactonase family protein [Candidatus Limivivens intestinipullorum]
MYQYDKKDKYVAYVGTYTHGSSIGIHVYDLDVENGYMTEREVIPVNNASHVARSTSGRYLYSIADEGVAVMRINDDGGLTPINAVGIDGMRGCFLSTDKEGRFLFVGGYHDGKVTVVHTHRDGRLGSVLDGIFHKGLGSVAERNFRPHVSCTMPTPDGKYLCVVDNGIDQIKLYTVNPLTGKLKLYDILRCELESGPRWIRFSRDGRFAYVICELSNEILVYSYDGSGKSPKFELLQKVETPMDKGEVACAASALKISPSGRYLYCSTAGDNSAGVYRINQETGILENVCTLPISGKYPKDLAVFPDEKTLVVLNHESNDIRFFTIDYEKGLLVMKGKPIKIETPNCILINKVGDFADTGKD